ncbi:MAG: 2-hydroxyacid dehydrogenase [Bacteroidia bacterium]|nr:2-hydroxyacid dehydrogenase [Bacteroidia bacterium]
MKVLHYSTHGFDRKFLEIAGTNIHEFYFTEDGLNSETAELAKGFEAITLFTSDDASSEVLKKLAASGIRYICLRSAGFDHVDLNTARELNIRVANVPAYSPHAVAEHALMLLMALNRKIIQATKLFSMNDFRLDTLVGFNVFGKTAGVVGTGKIGSVFVRILLGMGCRVLAYDINPSTEFSGTENFQYTDLDTLCMKSDIISLFCPLNSSTRYLFDKKRFSIMKKGVIFINTARGAIVNTSDLIEAIENGTVGAAGLDVYENEKPLYFKDLRGRIINDPLFEKLRNMPQVLLTAHQAFLTKEALEGIANTTVRNLSEWEKFGKSVNDLI